MIRWQHILCAAVLPLVFSSPKTTANTPAITYEKKVQKPAPAVASSSVPQVPAILLRIGGCESGGGPLNPPRQFNKNGTVLRGVVNPADVGAWQINEHYHLAAAKKLGIDIYTYEGNKAYALYLYEKNGTRDWNWSKSCWG